MGILSWIVLGIIAGALAKLLMPGPDGGGIFVTMLLGVAGAFVGGFIGEQLGMGVTGGGVNLASIGTATVGAFVLLFLYRLIKK